MPNASGPLVPTSDIENLIEVHLARHAPRVGPLYATIVLITGAIVAALPIVRVPITVQASGILRPVVERHDVRAPQDGIIAVLRTRDGARVDEGDTILRLHTGDLHARLHRLDSLLAARAADVRDLETLIRGGPAEPHAWSSAVRRQQWQEYRTIRDDLNAQHAAARRAAERGEALHARGFASGEDIEALRLEEAASLAAVRAHDEQARSRWTEAHAEVSREILQYRAERSTVLTQLAHTAAVAPVSGTIEISGLSSGTVVQKGERLATISPDTGLVAETYLESAAVGQIHTGMPVRLMIDALRYRTWGTARATIVDIANDATYLDGRPAIRVRSQLIDRTLYAGEAAAELRKGMSLRARFIVAERSLASVLFDQADAHLNPVRAASEAGR